MADEKKMTLLTARQQQTSSLYTIGGKVVNLLLVPYGMRGTRINYLTNLTWSKHRRAWLSLKALFYSSTVVPYFLPYFTWPGPTVGKSIMMGLPEKNRLRTDLPPSRIT